LDRLPQVGRGFELSTTSWRGTSQHPSKGSRPPPSPDYSNFTNNTLSLSNGHRGLMASPSWSGGPGHWKRTSPPSYPAQPTFLRLQLDRMGPGIGRARILQANQLSPPFCTSNLVGRAQALEGHESSKLPGVANLSVFLTRSGGPEHWKGTSPPRYPAQPISLRFQLGWAGSGIGWAWSPLSYPTPAHFSAPPTPTTYRA
jgi:hypothetical protein